MEPTGGQPPDAQAPLSDGSRPTTEQLYAEHWQFVFQLLPTYGVFGQDQEDVAQTVWQNVHTQIGTYDPVRQTPRAWVTGFVRRCAANYRRTLRRRPEMLMEEPGVLSPAPGLSPEDMALLRTLGQAIPDEERRETLILQVRHGLTIEEIAVVMGVSRGKVEWRLQMAKDDLKGGGDDDEKAMGAFLGFGSFAAFERAFQPAPVPFERGMRLWVRLAPTIGHGPGAGRGRPSASSPGSPGSLLGGSKRKLLSLGGSFLIGAATGVGALLLWQMTDASRYHLLTPPEQTGRADTPLVDSSPPDAPEPLSTLLSPSAAPQGSATQPLISERVILRMRRAAELGRFEEVLVLAEQHARLFPGQQAEERETQRVRALAHLGRATEAEQRANAEVQEHPERRRSMETAIGHSLP